MDSGRNTMGIHTITTDNTNTFPCIVTQHKPYGPQQNYQNLNEGTFLQISNNKLSASSLVQSFVTLYVTLINAHYWELNGVFHYNYE